MGTSTETDPRAVSDQSSSHPEFLMFARRLHVCRSTRSTARDPDDDLDKLHLPFLVGIGFGDHHAHHIGHRDHTHDPLAIGHRQMPETPL